MVSVQDLRDDANRCYRIARSTTRAEDKELFESLGEEANRIAARLEAEEAAEHVSRSE
jgi:hypothetical protein